MLHLAKYAKLTYSVKMVHLPNRYKQVAFLVFHSFPRRSGSCMFWIQSPTSFFLIITREFQATRITNPTKIQPGG